MKACFILAYLFLGEASARELIDIGGQRLRFMAMGKACFWDSINLSLMSVGESQARKDSSVITAKAYSRKILDKGRSREN